MLYGDRWSVRYPIPTCLPAVLGLHCICVVVATVLHGIFADDLQHDDCERVCAIKCLPAFRQKWNRPANPLEDAVSAAIQSVVSCAVIVRPFDGLLMLMMYRKALQACTVKP